MSRSSTAALVVIPSLVAAAAWFGCGNTSGGFTPGPLTDGGSSEASTDAAPEDEFTLPTTDASFDAAPSPRFFILVTETPAGSAPMVDWGGILRFDVADDFQPAIETKGADGGTWVDKSLVADPIGLAFRQTSAEVFAGNRRGNADGSITRFTYSKNTQSLTKTGDVATGDGAGAVMQIAFSHDEMELYGARGGGEITRFKFDVNGNMSPNGKIGGLGSMVGVAVSSDGKRLYATQQFSSTIREFQLPSGTEVPGFAVQGASRPHLMVMDPKNNRLYVSDIQSNKIFVLAVDANDDLSLKQSVDATNPISVALSPTGNELFSTSHNFSPPDVIERYRQDGGSWVTEGSQATISTATALGGTLVFLASEVPHPPPN